MTGLKIAVAQTPIDKNPVRNGAVIRQQMREARICGARLIHFPEGVVSGYVKSEIWDWHEVDWQAVRTALQQIAIEAGELGIWTIVGSAHPLSGDHRPHNSIYIINDRGELVDRYDKRFLSNSEINDWFTPGFMATSFALDGIRFGCALCIEINFPELFQAYARADVDVVLVSSYSSNASDELLARA